LTTFNGFIPIWSRRNGGAQSAALAVRHKRPKFASRPAARASPKIPSWILGQNNFLGRASVGILAGSSSLPVQEGTFHSEKSIENTWQIWSGPLIFALTIFLRGFSLNPAVFS
jgi:hypothetical protein